MQEEVKENEKQSTNESTDFINPLFKKKIRNTINNPDELNSYIKVLKPYTFFVLIAVIIFAIGISIWGVFGRITSSVNAYIDKYNGSINMYVDFFNKDNVKPGMTITFNNGDYIIDSIDNDRIVVDDEFIDEMYRRQIDDRKIGLHRGDYLTRIYSKDLKLDCESEEDGFYISKIIIESISPIKFLFN